MAKLTKMLQSACEKQNFINAQQCETSIIGIAPIMHVPNKNSNIQGRSPNVVKVIFYNIRNCSGSKFFLLREVLILKRDANEENHCLIQ